MRQTFFILLMLVAFTTYSQRMQIITLDNTRIEVRVLSDSIKTKVLTELQGKQDNSIRKQWTARTFKLSDGKILIEFYDKQAVLLNSIDDFNKLNSVRFVKNNIEFLKKNITYKIELPFEKGLYIVSSEQPKKLTQFKSDMPEYFDFDVYELKTGQILFLDKSQNFKSAAIYQNLKALASDNNTVLEELYGSEDDEHLMKRLAEGDPLLDYEPNEHLIYPKYEKELIKNHKLTLIDSKVYVSDFYGNLYKSAYGYYILLDDFNQLNVAKTNKIGIGTLRLYEKIEDVREAQRKYEAYKNQPGYSEHFFQKISDAYGKSFPSHVEKLIDSLPSILNFDKDQLTLDSIGIDLVDEALRWHSSNYALFDKWFPSVLAFYGQCYIKNKQDGQWVMKFDKESKVWIPEVKLKDGSSAFDWRNFYKDLYEGPVSLRWAGDWDESRKKIRDEFDIRNSN